ncbi:MAG: steroid delta-isomerase [Hyphomicrobiaceae bacterium]|nr:steroid delta-isomerase [Hyphomicrobiaceae bacterium]
MALWSEDAQYFEHPSKLLANGAAEIRERHVAGFRDAKPVGELISRVVLGNRVIDHERVTRTFPEGRGQLEVVAIYEVGEKTIDRAWFLFGSPDFEET